MPVSFGPPSFVLPLSFLIRASLLPILLLAIAPEAGHNWREMSGFLFGFPSLRFLRRFRFFDTTARTFAPWLYRRLSPQARSLIQVQSRLDEAEFPTASQSACNLFEWALNDWRAADGASTDALRPINNWMQPKDQHELLFNWETLAPFARRFPTQGQRASASSAGRSENAKKDILAADCRFFWKRHNQSRSRSA
jgi:hypothetical protein